MTIGDDILFTRERDILIARAFNLDYFDNQRDEHYAVNEAFEKFDALLLDGCDLPAGYSITYGRDGLRLEHLEEQFTEVKERIKDQYGRWHIHYRDDAPVDLLRSLLHHAERERAKDYDGMNRFRDNVITELRAMALTLKAAQMGGTHAEKDARLRGLEDLIESSVHRLQDLSFNEYSFQWWPDAVFSSNRAEARLQRRVWELEEALKSSKPTPETGSDDIPF